MGIAQTRRTIASVAATALVATGISSCSAISSASDDDPSTIRYLSSAGLVNHLELADALGYLGDLQLDRVGESQGGPDSLQALATGESDIATGPFNGATAKVVSTGVSIQAVVAAYGSSGDIDGSLFTLEGSDISDAEDLVGKKVAVNTLGANWEAFLDTYMAKAGMSEDEIDDVTLVPLPGVNIEAALREGQVDAAVLSFAGKELALKNGGLREVAADKDLMGEYNGGSYVLDKEFMDDHPGITRTIVEGLAKAVEWEQQHSVDVVREKYGEYLKETGRAADVATYDTWQGNGIASPGGVLSDHDFDIWIDWLRRAGEINVGAFEVSDLYTNEFNPLAQEK